MQHKKLKYKTNSIKVTMPTMLDIFGMQPLHERPKGIESLEAPIIMPYSSYHENSDINTPEKDKMYTEEE